MNKKKILLVLAGVILFLAAGRICSLAAEDAKGLVGWWKFEEPTWTGAAGEVKDSSGRGNDLTARGSEKMPAAVSVGKVKAGEFKASGNQYLTSVPDNQDLSVGTGDFTLVAWVKSNNPSAKMGILGQYTDDYAHCCYGFYQREMAYSFIVNGPHKGETWPILIHVPIRSGWHHLAGLRRDDKLYFYIDGKLAATKEGVTGINPDLKERAFLIGAGTSDSIHIGAYFDGQIADVKLFKSALSQAEIVKEYSRLKDVLGEKKPGEIVLYQQDFEKGRVGDKTVAGILYTEGADVTITDNAHDTSARALKVVYHPDSKQNHWLDLSPRIPAFFDGTLQISLRVKFENVVDPQNRAWLYPYIRVNVYDSKSALLKNFDLIHTRKTESENSADDNWIMLTKEIALPEGASAFSLNMYVYDSFGVSGTVYLDDIKITEKFK